MKTSSDALIIGGVELHSRLFIGTGKYGSDSLIPAVAEASGAEVITVALRRVDLGNSKDNVLSHIPGTMRLLPNTSGARTADEAVRIARLSRAAGCGDWIKIEVISDTRHLLPDGYETAKATETLAKEGFTVLPYMNPHELVNGELANVVPVGALIVTTRVLPTRELVSIDMDHILLANVVHAIIVNASLACDSLDMDAVEWLVKTCLVTAGDAVRGDAVFMEAVFAERKRFLAQACSV
jgi:Uncharacterized enzyme of thiazole biosynthesis